MYDYGLQCKIKIIDKIILADSGIEKYKIRFLSAANIIFSRINGVHSSYFY